MESNDVVYAHEEAACLVYRRTLRIAKRLPWSDCPDRRAARSARRGEISLRAM